LPLYENVFLVRPDVSTQQVEALAQQFTEILTANGGKVAKTEQWGLRNLAYRIKKNRKAHYVLFNIDAPPAAVAEMERNMRLSEDVLRTMTVSVDALEEAPSAMLQNKGRDEGRGGRREGRRGGRDGYDEGRGYGRDFDGGRDRDGFDGDRGPRAAVDADVPDIATDEGVEP
jgi:small subunit ribosomal protein S6